MKFYSNERVPTGESRLNLFHFQIADDGPRCSTQGGSFEPPVVVRLAMGVDPWLRTGQPAANTVVKCYLHRVPWIKNNKLSVVWYKRNGFQCDVNLNWKKKSMVWGAWRNCYALIWWRWWAKKLRGRLNNKMHHKMAFKKDINLKPFCVMLFLLFLYKKA